MAKFEQFYNFLIAQFGRENRPPLGTSALNDSLNLIMAVIPLTDKNSSQHSFNIGQMRFDILKDDDQVALVCKEWPSLSAYGNDFEDAFASLGETIADARRAYLHANENELSEKAKQFAAFLRTSLYN